MDICIISPVSNLEVMNLGDRIFGLAHLWEKFPHYREFLKKKKQEGKFIIMDCSAAERALVTEEILLDICEELMPNEVIAPDVLFNSEKTKENLESFLIKMKERDLLGKIEIFFCPQGKTQKEWLDCYKYGLNHIEVDVIGFSKIAVPKAWLGCDNDQGIMEGRHNCYNYLKVNDLLHKPIHCLGQGNPKEFAYYQHPMMRSTDSVFPVLAAMEGQDFWNDPFERIPTPHNFLETAQLDGTNLPLIEGNVNYLRKFAQKR